MRILHRLVRRMRLEQILYLTLVLTLLLSTGLISVFSYRSYKELMVEQLALGRIDVLSQVASRVDTLRHTMVLFSDVFYHSGPIQELVAGGLADAGEETEAAEALDRMNRQYDAALTANGFPLNYTVIAGERFRYHSAHKLGSVEPADYNRVWRYDFARTVENSSWLPTYRDVWALPGEEALVFSYARAIRGDDGRLAGYLLVNADEGLIRDTYRQAVGEANSIYIVDRDGRIISHSDESMIGFYFYRMDRLHSMFAKEDFAVIEKNGRPYLFSRHYDQALEWTIVEEIPMELVVQPLDRIQRLVALIALAVLALGMALSWLIARGLAVPLRRLGRQLEKVASSDGTVDFRIHGWAEIEQIGQECAAMNRRIYELVEREKQKEAKTRRLELDYLNAQMNPHFVHNTLFSLKCLLSMGETAAAADMATEFAALVEMVLRSPRKTVPLEQELFILNKYVSIIKYRTGERFEIRLDCDDRLLRCLVPRLILQPLVENSLLHGIIPSDLPGLIDIAVHSDGRTLHLSVTDNGVGFDPRKTASPQRLYERNDTIGLGNVESRIQLLYGEQYGLRVESEVGRGAKVSLWLPVVESPAEGAADEDIDY